MALANMATWRSRFRAWRARRASGTGGLQAMPAE
jgi:hypothetical protein